MNEKEFLDWLNPYPPYYTRKDPERVLRWVERLPHLSLKRTNEFPICGFVNSFDIVHPDYKERFAVYTARFRDHWRKLKLAEDRPGMNDYNIVCWSVTGDVSFLEKLIEARKRQDERGKTAHWAIDTLLNSSADFRKDITPLLGKPNSTAS
jgi:hypothetical protein